MAPWGVGLCAGLLALGPALGPGFILRYDMVFVPDPPFSPAALGAGAGFPRAVPSDAVVAAFATVLAADVVQKLFLLAIFAIAAGGAARLVPGDAMAPRLGAAMFYAWNPFLAERLLLGQWAMLLGYAGLPWVLCAAMRLDGVRGLPRLITALIPAAIGGFSSVLLSGIVAGCAALARPWRRAVPALGWVLAGLVLISLPWLVPALGSAAQTDPDAVELFAARADTPFGTVGSLLSLGGIWNAEAVPVGYGHPYLATCRLVLSVGAIAGWVWLLRRGPAVRYGGALTLAALVGGLIALVGVVEPGRAVLRALIGLWPGFGPLRDGQLYVAPLALLQALGFAGAAMWFARVLRRRAKTAPVASGEPGASTTPAATRVAAVVGVLALLAPLVALPGLAWGAMGRLTAVRYPQEWHEVQRIVNEDPAPGALLSLPWSAYRGLDWGGGRTTVALAPAVKLFDRRVVFNGDLRVAVDGEVRVARGEDPLARQVAPIVESGWPLAEEPGASAKLGALGVRYILIDRAEQLGGGLGKNMFLSGGPGLTVTRSGPELILLRISDHHVRNAGVHLSGLEVTGWLVTVVAIIWSIAASGSSLTSMPRGGKESPR